MEPVEPSSATRSGPVPGHHAQPLQIAAPHRDPVAAKLDLDRVAECTDTNHRHLGAGHESEFAQALGSGLLTGFGELTAVSDLEIGQQNRAHLLTVHGFSSLWSSYWTPHWSKWRCAERAPAARRVAEPTKLALERENWDG